MIKIINSDILDFKSDKKYHAVISDPPYGLAFMGNSWDKFKTPIEYQKWVTEWSSKLLDYLYPGAICMFFGGTRTHHRLATGLEDAGYEIFDSMIWCYGSGFPKSFNIAKGIEKSEGFKPDKIIPANGVGFMNSNDDGWHNTNNQHIYDSFKSDNANTWNGYGTALKPAYEPIVLCRKPLEKGGYVNSVLKYGTSGLNIDGGRIETSDKYSYPNGAGGNSFSVGNLPDGTRTIPVISNPLGRFPANFGLICTCEQEPCECNNGNLGESSRFFYTAKASSKERELGLDVSNNNRANNHPTVKPIKLIEYLATLLLPPIENSSILIPFSGVGSEMIGCHLAGWQNITGVEIDENYVNIANKRLEYWTQFNSYQDAISNKVLIDKTEELEYTE